MTIKDFMLHYLKHEYDIRSKIITNLVLHIERLCTDFIISNIERNKYIKILNETVKMLNMTYNNRINSLKSDSDNNSENIYIDDDVKYESKSSLAKIDNVEKDLSQIINLPFTININDLPLLSQLPLLFHSTELQKLCPSDYSSVDKKIYEIIYGIGAKSLNDVILMFTKIDVNSHFHTLTNSHDLLYILDKMFVPLYVVSKGSANCSDIKVIKPAIIPEKYEILLDNYYKVEINIMTAKDSVSLNVFGFFEYDCINSFIRTSQISNDYLFTKRKNLFDYINKNSNNKSNRVFTKMSAIPMIFKETYVKNMSIGDLLSLDGLNFANILLQDYDIYQKYVTINNFKILFSEFIQADLLVKYKIIKFLLLSSSISDAGLLFSLTKESKSGSTIISDIIHKNLNLSLQSKLHKANINIKSEIEKINELDSDDVDLKKQIIANKNMPAKVKKMALEKINEMKAGNSEYYKQLLYVKTLVDFPWTGDNDGDIFVMYQHDITKWEEIMTKTHEILHSKVYGHTECKETIIELVGKWFSNPKSLGKAVGLCGPPGVGKTLFAKELGTALGIPLVKINLGGMEDGAVLTGHSITYSGAVPGLIVKRMVEAGKPRCIMFFDELDKACYHHGRNEIFDTLIHVIDQTTNSEYNDKFFQDINFPINKVLYIFSFNDKSKIDPILLDRMEIINVDAYTPEDKINIVNKFLINELKTDIGLNNLTLKMTDDDITYLIDSYTQEPGVRSIKRKLEKIMLKLNKERIFKTGPFEKSRDITELNITKELIDHYLIKPTILIKKIGKSSEIGIVNGLYATSMGDGGIIPILIYKNQTGNSEKFVLKLTGKQGKVMQESVSFAFTIAINLIKTKYASDFFDNYPSGLHIHTPDGATAKDGPSAGSAFTLAFISRILNKKIKNDIALTGEIDRDGFISAIGGLEYKLPGAKRAGVKLVFVPKENEKDLQKVITANKSLFDNDFKYQLVDHINEVLDMALFDNEYLASKTYDKLFDHKLYVVDKNDGKQFIISKNQKKIIKCSSSDSLNVTTSDDNNIESESSDMTR